MKRNYVYKYEFGKEGPEGRINNYADIDDSDDLLEACGCLIIQRSDEMEMSKDEIKKIREDFFNDSDIEEFLCFCSVDSYHKDNKLYFFVRDRDNEEASCIPLFEEEFLRFIHESFRLYLLYGDHKLIKRNLGFDLIYHGLQEEFGNIPDIALVCIYDFNHFNEQFEYRVRSITEEELRDILQNTIDYKNREIILYNVELSENAKEYAKNQNVGIKTIIDIMKDRKMLESELNDATIRLKGESGMSNFPNHNNEELDKIRKWLSKELRRFEPKL